MPKTFDLKQKREKKYEKVGGLDNLKKDLREAKNLKELQNVLEKFIEIMAGA